MASFARSTVLRQAFKTPSAVATMRPMIQTPVRSAVLRQVLQQQTKVAFFQTSAKRSILIPLPQSVRGTVNDPAPVPTPHPTHGSYHWTFERLMSAALIPLTIAPFVGGALNPLMDSIFCAAILIHSHIGFEAVVCDYIPAWRMPNIRKAADWLLKLATVIVGIGFYQFETNDIGITAAVAKIWTS